MTNPLFDTYCAVEYESDSEEAESHEAEQDAAHMSYNTNISAITSQIQSKLNHEVHLLPPSLHGIANLLSEGTAVAQTTELAEFSTVLTLIQEHLQVARTSRMQSNTLSDPEDKNPLSTTATPPRSMYKRKQCALLPPSPECRQVRKDSYAPL